MAVTEPPPPPVTDPDPLQIRTLFGTTRTDHYPLDAQNDEPDGHNWDMVVAESEIASRDDVLAFLRENAFEISLPGVDAYEPPHYFRDSITGHASPPVVRFLGPTTPEARRTTIRAMDNINAWLPWDKHITVGKDVGEANSEALHEANTVYSQKQAELDAAIEADDGSPYAKAAIEVARTERKAARRIYWETLYATKDGDNVIIANMDADLKGTAGGTGSFHVINIDESFNDSVNVIQHELLHALGLGGGRSCYEKFGADCDSSSFDGPMYYYSHVDVKKFPESTMAYASPYNDINGLSQIDGETLQAIYAREHLWEHPDQEDAVGILEHPDLTGAFGGVRE